MEKIDSLKGEDISLPDNVVMEAKKRAEAKTKRLAERQATKKIRRERPWRRLRSATRKRFKEKNPNSLNVVGIFFS